MDVPRSKRDDIDRRYQSDSERLEAVVKEWRAHHPAPSWKGLAWALYKEGELRALWRLYGKYLTGMSCDLTFDGCFIVVTFITLCCMCNGNLCSYSLVWGIQYQSKMFAFSVLSRQNTVQFPSISFLVFTRALYMYVTIQPCRV